MISLGIAERIALAAPDRKRSGKSLQVCDRDVVRQSERDLQLGRNLTEKCAYVAGMLFGQLKIRKAMCQLGVFQLPVVGRVHGRQDGYEMLHHSGRKLVVSGRRHKLPLLRDRPVREKDQSAAERS
ncbi:hypothetical protein, partial [Mesorhizobium sp.]|uniref:hypothetical protein n=1 Tax=Mesorhizobium sp. TaxID=1871066 RepID=UPI0025F1AD51